MIISEEDRFPATTLSKQAAGLSSHPVTGRAQLGLRMQSLVLRRQLMTAWYGSCLGVTVVSRCDDPRPAAAGSTWGCLEMHLPSCPDDLPNLNPRVGPAVCVLTSPPGDPDTH